ncbi:PREDICTED: G-type lectin S-receptor-like serine/threonine-protein kinase At4g03230 isoform X2 [Nelumbo nucifera]|uniref:Receptor-like serine/threonine-protein kinase n=2 Tax=Nelumbo nucifera TaxID=4432 RepID=A0A1U8AY95_NELNU|nr:PREDICTED: G-type lectin S-receptor-like serine/threonine-protein kinase At4g03230 isoform X2 [Nelumbo nucifera]DAD42602.1 TPA_asm: hypothetical protein HUJ06_000832 [Nelumbo nucifera]
MMWKRGRVMWIRWFATADNLISFSFFSAIFLSCSSQLFCSARDTITPSQPIFDRGVERDTLVSTGGIFELGFFTPGDDFTNGISTNKRYLGIWYHGLSPRSVVWVANRNQPILDRQGVFQIGQDGNLNLLDKLEGKVVWSSSKVSSAATANTTAKLLDTGNFILSGGDQAPIWQSFIYDEANPSNTFLPGMKLEVNQKLQSWIDEYDPAYGDFIFERSGPNQFTIKNRSTLYWRSGSSEDFSVLEEMPKSVLNLLLNYTSVKRDSLRKFDNNSRLVIDPSGQIKHLTKDNNSWSLLWFQPSDDCSVVRACGPNGVCNSSSTPVCSCLPGFNPKESEEWNSGKYSNGCTGNTEECKEMNFFSLYFSRVRIPESSYPESENEKSCRDECLDKCCYAYSYSFEPSLRLPEEASPSSLGTHSCWIWSSSDNLIDLQVDNSYTQVDRRRKLYFRVANFDSGRRCSANFRWDPTVANCIPDAAQESHSPRKQLIFIVVIPITAVIIFSCIVTFLCCLRRIVKGKGYRENIQPTSAFHLDESGERPSDILDSEEFIEDDKKGIGVPFFNFETIAAVTENFSDSNKLGQGGFGPVYKGQLPGGQEIAVKRLSRSSGQGLEEFKNEVLLISKLQHRNLVRLLGYSIKGDEKILLYEYMPNKSLDSFIFDQTHRLLLNWEMCFNIIMGIARGLLYLHQDSRLRVIHRDLKTSNILLDEEMNPKISDFGLARIFGGKQTEGNTSRVVGTYGYMSPEYALDGLFSIKSDVFSFGVVLLEIISGKKNTGFYQSEHTLTLLGYAWKLWKEGKMLALTDKSLCESCNAFEVTKCIHVALLCVQEEADDRPTMSNVGTEQYPLGQRN